MMKNTFWKNLGGNAQRTRTRIVAAGGVCYLILLALSVLHSTAHAQSVTTEAPAAKKTITNAKGEKITVIDFDDANIEGKAKAPDGFVVQSRQSGKFKGMIELRRDFRPQMEQATLDALASMGQN
jgi:hypothetical protein